MHLGHLLTSRVISLVELKRISMVGLISGLQVRNSYKLFLKPSMYDLVGIMAGMHHCGVIVLLSELFISESLPQVYGSLHQFYASNPTAASNISKN